MMYAEQHRFQPHHQQQYDSYRESQSNVQFQYSSTPKLSGNLDPDSIMKVHDDLPSAAILAWERLKAKKSASKKSATKKLMFTQQCPCTLFVFILFLVLYLCK